MSRQKIRLCLIAVVLSLALFMQAQTVNKKINQATWQLLGIASLLHSTNHDKIIVQEPFGFCKKLKFRVRETPLKLQKMVVMYDDGTPENIDLQSSLPRGGQSRVIILQADNKKIISVQFWYEPVIGLAGGKGDVALYGMR